MLAGDQLLGEPFADLGAGSIVALDQLELDALRQILLVQLQVEIDRLLRLIGGLRDKPGIAVDQPDLDHRFGRRRGGRQRRASDRQHQASEQSTHHRRSPRPDCLCRRPKQRAPRRCPSVASAGRAVNDRPAACRSGLLDIPHQIGGRLEKPLQVLVIGGVRFPLPGRQIGHHLEGALLDRRC